MNNIELMTRVILSFVFMVLAALAVLAWYDWRLLVVLVLWTVFTRLEAKL